MASTVDASKKHEEVGENALFVDKDSVLQDTKYFDTPDRGKWMQLFADLAILEQRGELENLTNGEKNKLFFSVTKVFAKADAEVKTVALDLVDSPALRTPEAFILFSSVAKCLTTDSDIVCGRAIKWIFNNVDYHEVMNTNAFRQMEASLGSKDESSDYPASVIALALEKGCRDPSSMDGMKSIIGQKFRSSLSARLASRESYSQLPILRVLRYVTNDDALFKMMASNRLNLGPLANVQILRYVRRMYQTMPQKRNSLLAIVDLMLKNQSEMVQLEAAKVMLDLGEEQKLSAAIRVLSDFLTSHKSCLKFAAAKQLSRLASRLPVLINSCSVDLEGLINDQNRSIACMAITALLQSGSEDSMTRLLKQISTFLSELDDGRKKIIVESVAALKKYKSKVNEILLFLANLLREEGGASLKEAVFKSMVEIMQDDPTCSALAMGHLSEFIEDCEHDNLSTNVLHFLGEHSSNVKNPSKYIRYIYNRVILESATVRAAAVSALSSIAHSSPDLKEPIKSLLETSITDSHSEVRDRAALGICSLNIPDSEEDDGESNKENDLDLDALEYSLTDYIKSSDRSEPFTILDIRRKPAVVKDTTHDDIFKEKPKKEAKVVPAYKHMVAQYAALQAYGPLIRSTEEESLVDDPDAEYIVSLTKHIHMSQVVFQFDVENNTEDQKLTNIRIEMELSEGLELEDFGIELARLEMGQTGSIFLVCSRAENCFDAFMDAVLHFHVQDAKDEDDDGYDDEFELSVPVALSTKDFIRPTSSTITEREFSSVWSVAQNKVSKTGKLSKESLEAAVSSILEVVGLYPVGNSHVVEPEKQAHSLFLSGIFLSSMPVYAIIKFIQRPGIVKFKVECASDDAKVSEMVVMDIFS